MATELLRGSHKVTQIDVEPTIQLEPEFRRFKLRRWRFEKSIIGWKLLGRLSGRPDVTRRQTTIELNKIRRAYQTASPTKRRQLRKLAMQISARFQDDKPEETPSFLAPGAKKETRTNWRVPSLREED